MKKEFRWFLVLALVPVICAGVLAATQPYTCTVPGVGKVQGGIVDKLGVAVYKVQTSSTVGKDVSTKAKGKFLLISLAVRSFDKEDRVLDGIFSLIGKDGKRIGPSEDGTTTLEMSGGKTFFLASIDPGDTMMGSVVFDVPASSKTADFKLQIDTANAINKGGKLLLDLKVVLVK